MQRKWILGLTTAMILVGCEQGSQQDYAANSNDSKKGVDATTALDKAKEAYSTSIPSQNRAASGSPEFDGMAPPAAPDTLFLPNHAMDTENYAAIDDNPVKEAAQEPVSTFSIDVDTGSYANVRRFLMNGQLPPREAVRVEEMINYFAYDYAAPEDRKTPFAVASAVAKTPWNPDTFLLRVSVKGAEPDLAERPPANLVFLIDVSGSMSDPDKLPLLKSGMKMLAKQMRPQDKVSIVVYAGAAGLALEPTQGDQQRKIIDAIEVLEAGGSTAGGEGLALAYAEAAKAKIDGGINRVILATDGDFNVGLTDIGELKRMIEVNREDGVSLTTLGFGEGNYNDALMEQLADVGNGNYGYVDSVKEAKRLLVDQLGGTIQTIAKDVKIQIEFNPSVVAEYRLIGYENRALQRRDFNDDKKDAGEIGAGHSVTALYEIALKGSRALAVDPLRYAAPSPASEFGPDRNAKEFAFLRLRYKSPDGNKSQLLETPLPVAALIAPQDPGKDFEFAAAVAAFGQMLRANGRIGEFDFDRVMALAEAGKGEDRDGYRAEFVELVEIARELARSPSAG
jgi:Ca-activated chloride channel family protein